MMHPLLVQPTGKNRGTAAGEEEKVAVQGLSGELQNALNARLLCVLP